jgi:NAD(P)-dependent dehydrogenase (short-subunit alcohol dehydrogenase family)
MDLTGRIAVVTGGGRGIGAGIARALAKAGARVAVAGRNEDHLRAVATEIGGVAVRCDVASADDVGRLARAVKEQLGAASIVVNNAGISASAKFADTDEALWQRTIDVNLTGSYRVTRAFLADVVAAGAKGRIVFMASTAARVGFYYTSAYCASSTACSGWRARSRWSSPPRARR